MDAYWSRVLSRCLSFLAAGFGQMTQAPMLPYIWRDLKGTDLGYGLWFVEFCTLQLVGNLASGKTCTSLPSTLSLAA